ncbi:endonuclease III [Candidatus Nitronereus thalassa]|uniref:Endonuclease III n=1 Tax=Candidatus Nitronereus thalassa TaxID=3020898 RepID=A0ABU3K6M6_9BACT|nr:endonuclease III [Candidatus Nitronereus thalassa]MDT7042046.1 endonuclease III [Candidatus Nitronereus thalassa]
MSAGKSGTSVKPDAKARACRIIATLKRALPEAIVELQHRTPFELLVATILSAQCTDERVNSVTPALFAKYPGPQHLAKANPADVEAIIRSTGFFRSKAKSVIHCSQGLVELFNGKVPDTMEELTSLPGIGRKTANVILGACFQKPGIIVDTHVKRVANRLHLTTSHDPTTIEYDLQALLPQQDWTGGSQRFLLHGRYVCLARKPKCGSCVISADCDWDGKLMKS